MENFNEPEVQATSDNFSLPGCEQDGLSSQADWGQLSDDDAGYLQKKGMHSPSELLHSYRELEKAYSSRIALPKDGDKKSVQKFYSHLGMPENCEGFELSFDEEDKPFMDTFKQACLENNILPQSAQALYDWYTSHRSAQVADAEEKWLQQSQAEMEEQKREWGVYAPRQMELMRRGIRLFAEDDEDAVCRIEEALGTKRTMQIFSRLGEAVSEDNSVGFGGYNAREDTFDPVAYFKEMFHDS